MKLKNCNYLVFIASPFHAWMAKEYLYANKIMDYQIILWLHDQHSDYAKTQLDNTLKYLQLNNIIDIEFPSFILRRLVFERQFVKKLKQQVFKYILFFDFRNLFLQSLRRHFKASNFTLIDDGFATVIGWDKKISKGQYLPEPSNFWRNVIFLYYFKAEKEHLKEKSFKIFSIFTDYLNGDGIIENNLVYLRNRLLETKKELCSSEYVLILGTRLVRRGLMTEIDEKNILSYLKTYWGNRGKQFIYVAKRSSNKSDLERVCSLNISVWQPDLPIELELCRGKYLPYAICTFGSTAMRSIQVLFPKVPIYYIRSKNLADKDETGIAFENYFRSVSVNHSRIINVD